MSMLALQAAGLRSQTAPRQKYSSAGAQAALTAFYTHAGKLISLLACSGLSWSCLLQITYDLVRLHQGRPHSAMLLLWQAECQS